jgi:hypothetical protein
VSNEELFPLSRPLFLYLGLKSLEHEAVAHFHLVPSSRESGASLHCPTLLHDVVLNEYEGQSTDHELIPARDVSLAAIQSSASESNVRYYPT